ncbi:MAG: hypothetical protein FHP92_20085 [Denitromonas halophila]|nr:MAG: hypothetical protein FHP92_20085 [Denitromonas halophila]
MFIPKNHAARVVGVVLLGLFICFVREWVKPDVAAMRAVTLRLGLGLLDAKQVRGVFSNSAPITITCLFVISEAQAGLTKEAQRSAFHNWTAERWASLRSTQAT